MGTVGEAVEHPRYGRGTVVAVYRGGADWLVRFQSGLRFRRPREEFAGADGAVAVPTVPRYEPPPPMPRDRYEARSVVESLRVGIAPQRHLRQLTIGMGDERADLAAALNRAHAKGGDVRAIIGEYGFGKSHLLQLAAEEALARNFLVASTSLDLEELPAHRAFAVYTALARSVRYPDGDEAGLGPLLDAAAKRPDVLALLRERAPVAGDPLQIALTALESGPPRRMRAAYRDWLMGGRRLPEMRKVLARGTRMPTIYTTGYNARQLAYLLTALSALARAANYSGLVVLVDEAESYALLRPRDREKAGVFFGALVAGALGPGGHRIADEAIPEHRHVAYPPSFGSGQGLLFLFTLTHSDQRMPLERWLEPAQVRVLDPRPSVRDIGQFIGQVLAYHAAAYDYAPDVRHGQVRRAATEHLAAAVRGGRLSMRGVVRHTVELLDLLFLHPEYDAAQILDELQQQLR